MHPLTGVFAVELLLMTIALRVFGRERVLQHAQLLASLNAVMLTATWAIRWRLGLLEPVVA